MTGEILKIAVKTPLYRTFDYLPPSSSSGPSAEPGCRVQVSFGRRRLIGVVWASGSDSELPRNKLKRIDQVLDAKPILDEQTLALIKFAADYYQHAPGEVVAAALPQLLRDGRSLTDELTRYCAVDGGQAPSARAPVQREIYAAILAAGGNGLEEAEAKSLTRGSTRALAVLLEKGCIEKRHALAVAAVAPTISLGESPTLSEHQQSAVDAVLAGLDEFNVTLLDGVTGSGKTEVYLQLIAKTMAAGKQVLVIVPEIGLTPQLTRRFERRLGVAPTEMHSGLTASERLAAWRAASEGSSQLIVGTRSAIFAPLIKPGLIIIDEEHDASLKQQEGFRYSARDLAIVRARLNGISVVLGSATPSLESLANVDRTRYQRVELPTRVGDAKPPTLRIVDLNQHGSEEGLSGPVREAVVKHLNAGGQAMFYINRRGFAPTLICGDCGYIVECERCDSRLTLHAARQQLACHHCGFEQSLSSSCPKCTGILKPLGEGSERIERALERHFPGETIVRIDSDTTRRKGELEHRIEQARSGEGRLLVGTQMLSKGHHFPQLTLVNVLNVDQGLFGTDFRVAERLAQSLVQVAGRAGRASVRGEVMIQSAFPQHPFLTTLLDQGYAEFAKLCLHERQLAGWPPFASLAVLRAEGPDRQLALDFLARARSVCQEFSVSGVNVYGPVRAAMEKRAGRYRAQLLLQADERTALRAVLRRLRPWLDDARAHRQLRWALDIDPIELG